MPHLTAFASAAPTQAVVVVDPSDNAAMEHLLSTSPEAYAMVASHYERGAGGPGVRSLSVCVC